MARLLFKGIQRRRSFAGMERMPAAFAAMMGVMPIVMGQTAGFLIAGLVVGVGLLSLVRVLNAHDPLYFSGLARRLWYRQTYIPARAYLHGPGPDVRSQKSVYNTFDY